MRQTIMTMISVLSFSLLIASCGVHQTSSNASEVLAPPMQVCVDGKQKPAIQCNAKGQCYFYNPCTGQIIPAAKPHAPGTFDAKPQ